MNESDNLKVYKTKFSDSKISIKSKFITPNLVEISSLDNENSPFLAARIPPVAAPLMIEFQGSSFFLMCTKVQSMVLNMPPHTAKFPAMIGDLVLMAERLPN